MTLKFANNASSTLSSSILATDTSLSVAGADAGKFPSLLADDWFPLTIVDNAGNMEIVKVTARSGAMLTVERGQEGTAPKAFVVGSKCDLRLTAAALAALRDDLGSRMDTDPTLAANSDSKIASQKAVKSYFDSTLAAAIDAIKGGVSTAFDTLKELADAVATKFDKVGGTLTGNLILQLVSPMLRLNHTGVNDWGILNHTDGKLYVQKLNGTPANALVIGVDGSISTAQFGDLNARIEARAVAWANDRVANLQYRKVSLGYNGISGGYSNIGGTVVVGYARDAGVSGQVNGLYYMYLQVFDPVRGWVGFSG